MTSVNLVGLKSKVAMYNNIEYYDSNPKTETNTSVNYNKQPAKFLKTS